ncbi:MAG: ornithine carbamoyltransferase [Actinobacteria bacterium]|nr:ornithine carbamoyltransferase [Actinomycetota bacterium]
MISDFHGRDVLTLDEFTGDEILALLSKAKDLKGMLKKKEPHNYLDGKTIALIFQKPSTRTRISFEAGIAQLGAYPLYLNANDMQLGRGETIDDTGRVLSRYVEAIVIRTFAQEEIELLAEAASIPVINGLSDDYHPCQSLADLLTILEIKNRFSGIKLAYLGDGNNVVHSLLLGSAKVGMDIFVATPEGYEPSSLVVEKAKNIAKNSKVEIMNDPEEAVKDADVVYTDVWTSMGQESEGDIRKKIFVPYQINSKILSYAKSDTVVMHCLPAHRGEEITNEVMDGPNSVVFDQAENRLHTQKALLALLLG